MRRFNLEYSDGWIEGFTSYDTAEEMAARVVELLNQDRTDPVTRIIIERNY